MLAEVVVATPFALLAMAVEHGVARWRGREVYRYEGLIGDLSNSIGNFVGQGLFGLTGYAAYQTVHARYGALDVDPRSPLAWLASFVLIDFVFYWRHRASHRVGLLWAIHEVHHQPRECNLGTAQRLSWLESLPNIPFLLVVAAIGVPLPMAAACCIARTGHSLFTHTQLVGRLGWIERVFVTPSHHRVHHASNPGYLDTNYGSFLILWDKLFGSFAEEREAPRFGTLHPRDIDDAWEANAGPLADLLARARRAPTWLGALETLLRPPSWDPVARREALPAALPPVPPARTAQDRAAMGVGFGLTLIGMLVGVQAAPHLTTGARWAVGFALMAAVIAVCSRHVPSPRAALRSRRA